MRVISRLHINESSPNLDVCPIICNGLGRGIIYTKRGYLPDSSRASIGRNGRRSERASWKCVTERARRLRALWLRRWAGESARARAAQIHVHTRKERSNSVKRAATLARKSLASARQQNLAALSCSNPDGAWRDGRLVIPWVCCERVATSMRAVSMRMDLQRLSEVGDTNVQDFIQLLLTYGGCA